MLTIPSLFDWEFQRVPLNGDCALDFFFARPSTAIMLHTSIHIFSLISCAAYINIIVFWEREKAYNNDEILNFMVFDSGVYWSCSQDRFHECTFRRRTSNTVLSHCRTSTAIDTNSRTANDEIEDESFRTIEVAIVFGWLGTQTNGCFLFGFIRNGRYLAFVSDTVEDGVHSLVQTELNAVYDSGYHQVKMIETNVLSQTTEASSRRTLQVVTGSHLQTQLNIISANEPSPEKSDVVAKVQAILEDNNKLMYLLTNITSRRAADDTALYQYFQEGKNRSP
jgi:hypothetical protein